MVHGWIVAVGQYYIDDTLEGTGAAHVFGPKTMARMLAAAAATVAATDSDRGGGTGSPRWKGTEATDAWLLQALRALPVAGSTALVLGSTTPLHESWLLALGARHVHVLDYNPVSYADARITSYTPDTFPGDLRVDLVLAVSTLQYAAGGSAS